jgi:polyphosphate kinase
MKSEKNKMPYVNRELSWLSFNERVLQEAENPDVPLLERIRFLGIFSNNQDEFFRVRVASHKRLLYVKKGDFDKGIKKEEVKVLLESIQRKVLLLQKKFYKIFFHLLDELKKQGIYWVDETKLSGSQIQTITKYFKEEVLSTIFPLILDEKKPFPHLRDSDIYLAIKMTNSQTGDYKYAIVEIPSKIKGRFYLLPTTDKEKYIIFLDDVIRCNLNILFSSLNYHHYEAYTIKLTRDAELDFEMDISDNMFEKIKKAIKQRKIGNLVRFVYDKDMPDDMRDFLVKKLKLTDDSLIPGQRYHNFKDLMKFPVTSEVEKFLYTPMKPLPVVEFDEARSMFEKIGKKDYLLNHPYQSFDYIVRFLREAAVDPNVTSIFITLYRVAEHSNVVNALINAVKNGKKVFVMMELKARFDEESNIYWSDKLLEAGADIFYGYEKIKVHSKICLVIRKEGYVYRKYAHLGTGNYNGQTSRIYCDHGLFTSDLKITSELTKVFDLVKNFHAPFPVFKHLLVAPVNLKEAILKKIDREIAFAQKGRPAWLKFKMNNLVDMHIIRKLYEASQAGVQIQLIVRGICCLKPQVKEWSERIHAISIIDRFLEHSRFFCFANNGQTEVYVGSADMMTRNLEDRIEVLFPLQKNELKENILYQFDLQWSDNVKARILDDHKINQMKKPGLPKIRSQQELYVYLQTGIPALPGVGVPQLKE